MRRAIAAPGTIALIGSAEWEDISARATLRSEDDDPIGLVFRYRDEQNYYRFSMSRSPGYRRLVRRAAGRFFLLWEDNTLFNIGQSYRLQLHIWHDRLVGYMDETLLFSVRDKVVSAGRV